MKEENWRKRLTAEEYKVLREGGTERPWSGKFLNNKESGVYKCRACGAPLFSSETKFDSGTGWPSFSEVISNRNVVARDDDSLGMRRTEVLCKNCGSHLGHVFPDGPKEKGGQRYCINSVCLDFEKKTADRTNDKKPTG